MSNDFDHLLELVFMAYHGCIVLELGLRHRRYCEVSLLSNNLH